MPDETAAEALERIGFDGERLLKLCYAVANHFCDYTGSGLDSRIDDLAAFLAIVGCRYACRYDPARSGPGYSPASFLFDVMERRCTDWMRQRGEGFGDRRYGHDNRVDFVGLSITNDVREDGVTAPTFGSEDGLDVNEPLADAAAELADRHQLSREARWALKQVAIRIDAGYTEHQSIRMAAKASGIRTRTARARLKRLRDELAEHALAA